MAFTPVYDHEDEGGNRITLGFGRNPRVAVLILPGYGGLETVLRFNHVKAEGNAFSFVRRVDYNTIEVGSIERDDFGVVGDALEAMAEEPVDAVLQRRVEV